MKNKILILICCLHLNLHYLQATPSAGEAAGKSSDVQVRTSSAEPGYAPGESDVPTKAKVDAAQKQDSSSSGTPPKSILKTEEPSSPAGDKKTVSFGENAVREFEPMEEESFSEEDSSGLSNKTSSQKSTMQVAYDSIKKFFDQIGIKIKDVIASWSKMSSKQVEKLQTDITAIDSDYAQTASKELSSYLDSAKKVEGMSEGPEKDALQGDLIMSKLTAVKSIIDLVRNDPDNPATLQLLQDLPSDMSEIVNKAVAQPKGIFDQFEAEQGKSSDEIVSDFKNKQSERALAAQKKVEAKMKEKPTQTPEEALKSVQLKATPTNQPALFVDKDAQTDFSGVTKNAKPTPAQPSVDLFAEKKAEPAQPETQVSSQAPKFLNDISQGQFKLKKLDVEINEESVTDGSQTESLENTLKKGLTGIRKATGSDDEEGQTDDEDENDDFFGQSDLKVDRKVASTKSPGAGVPSSSLATNAKVNSMLEQASKKK